MNITGFRVIAWGTLLIVINFNINNFDIFPDWLGYILILLGSNQVKNQIQYVQFHRASQFAVALLIIGLLKTFMTFTNNPSITFSVIEIGTTILLVTVIYYLFDGIYHLAQSLQQNIFAQTVHRNWLFFFIVNIVTLVATPFMQSLASEPAVIILLVIIALIAMLLIVFTLFKAARLQIPTDEHDPQ